jgi:hypothetical protein
MKYVIFRVRGKAEDAECGRAEQCLSKDGARDPKGGIQAPHERARVPVHGYGQVDAEWALNAFDIARSVRNKQ